MRWRSVRVWSFPFLIRREVIISQERFAQGQVRSDSILFEDLFWKREEKVHNKLPISGNSSRVSRSSFTSFKVQELLFVTFWTWTRIIWTSGLQKSHTVVVMWCNDHVIFTWCDAYPSYDVICFIYSWLIWTPAWLEQVLRKGIWGALD